MALVEGMYDVNGADEDFDGLVHTVCPQCNNDRALCGAKMDPAAVAINEHGPDDCVVCEELNNYPCKECGY